MSGLAHKDDFYESPKWILTDFESENKIRFNVDICANELNKKCHYYIDEQEDALKVPWKQTFADPTFVYCNPPRSKNGKFVTKAYEEWQKGGIDIFMLLCWNDLGNNYGKKYLFPYILSREIEVTNYGKIIFDKGGLPSDFPSRLTYFGAWFKKRNT